MQILLSLRARNHKSTQKRILMNMNGKLKIKDIELSAPVIAAPMAGITNAAYRRLLKEADCPLTVTEMVSDCALIYGNKETIDMIRAKKEDHPLSVQLFGGSKETILKAAEVLFSLGGFEILDLNLGCPVHKVVKGNAGSSWLKPERRGELADMVNALVALSPVPITCKVRLGWDESSICLPETCSILEQAGVSLIAVHARTRSQMYSGSPQYEILKQVRPQVGIPLIANGDIRTLDDALNVMKTTGCDGVMIGRGALGNPNLIRQIVGYFKTGKRIPDASFEERIEALRKHYAYLKELKGESKASAEMRGLASHYLKGIENAREFRARLSTMRNESEFQEILSMWTKTNRR